MINPFVMEIVIEILKAIVGVAIPALTIYLTFYQRRLNEKLERKALQDEVDRLTSFVSQSRSFEIMDYESKVQAIIDSVVDYTMRNNMNSNETEIRLMVESSFNVLRSLERTGLKLYMEAQNGKAIKK